MAQAREPSLTIVHIADIANLLSIDSFDRPDMQARGGMARVVGAIDAIRSSSSAVLVTHAGNAISPSPFSLLDDGAHMIDVMNRVGFDVMSVGSHEFDFGPAIAERRFAEAQFPVLISNARHASGEPLASTKPSIVVDVGGFRVAVIGAVTTETMTESRPGDVYIVDPVATVSEEATRLRNEGAQLVVALAGLNADENQRLLEAQTVDLILGGHGGHMQAMRVGHSYLVEPDSQGRSIAVVDLYVDTIEREIVPDGVGELSPSDDAATIDDTAEWFFDMTRIETETRVAADIRFVDTINVAPEVFTGVIVQQYAARFFQELGTALGSAAVALDTRRTVIRSREAVFGDLLADAMRVASGADAAIVNAGAIRGDTRYPAGAPLTLNTVFTELPYDNRVVVQKLTGAQIAAALVHGIAHDEPMAGRFPQVSGLTVHCRAAASRSIEAIEIGGEVLDPARTYRVATSDFLADGGDGYDMLVGAPIEPTDYPRLAEVLAAYIRDHGAVGAPADGRLDCP